MLYCILQKSHMTYINIYIYYTPPGKLRWQWNDNHFWRCKSPIKNDGDMKHCHKGGLQIHRSYHSFSPPITTSFRQLSSTRFVHFKKCCGRWPPRCLKLGLQKISLHLGFLSQNTLRKKCCDGSVSRTVGGHVSVWPIIFYIMIQAHRILMGYSWEELYIFTVYVFNKLP